MGAFTVKFSFFEWQLLGMPILSETGKPVAARGRTQFLLTTDPRPRGHGERWPEWDSKLHSGPRGGFRYNTLEGRLPRVGPMHVCNRME
jgi:hypothetical protein